MELTTRRLLLRPLHEDDARAMALGLNNISVSRNLARVAYPYREADAQDFFKRQKGFDPRSVICGITFKCAPDELIGMISYEIGQAGAYEFGYWLNESCWGMRIMSEAAAAMVCAAFDSGIDELRSSYHSDNPNSGRILRRLGFAETHQQMSPCLAQGKDVPTIKLRLTRAEWLAQKESRAA